MLHKRYDWTKNVFIASVLLTLFLGSQTTSLVNEVDSKESVMKTEKAILNVVKEKSINSSQYNSDYNFYIVRR